MTISSIVAISNNRAIGVDNDLPWHMPADLKFFKEKTMGKHVLMGRKSFESINKPLPGRTNIIVTRQKDFQRSDIIIKHSLSEGIKYAKDAGVDELFILGGANIYEQTQNIWDQMYITKIDTHIDNATAYFPAIDTSRWILKSQEDNKADEKNPFDYSFCFYTKK
jgi:dihydrofolate reductase